MTVIAGLDFGTSSVKLVVANPQGEILARAQADYPTTSGSAGEVEQDAQDWWTAAATVIAEAGFGREIDAIGVTGQMQDLIPVAGNRALRPALLYSDTRARQQHDRLRASVPEWEQVTGNQQDPTNVAAKIAWLAQHEPAVLADAEYLLLGATGYIGWRATGTAACDVVTASTTGLLDVHQRDWFGAAVTAAGARLDQLPALVGSRMDTVIGTVGEAAALELGVRADIPVIHALGDAGSATDGFVGLDPGDAYLYLGTTGWFAAVTPWESETPPTPIHSLMLPGWQTCLRIGGVQSAGSTAEWSRRAFLPGLDFNTVEERAAVRVSDTAALAVRPLALPGLAGERTPVRSADFRGAFVGIHDATEPVDFHLAVLTGVAFALRHVADTLGVVQHRLPLVGGAAASPAWRQILADVFGATVVTRDEGEAGAHSALRAVATALSIPHQMNPLFQPGAGGIETAPSPASASYQRLVPTHRALYDALTPTFSRLSHTP